MPKCHICGKSGLYTELMDYTVYSIHPRCERTLLFTTCNVEEFRSCSVCNKMDILPSKRDLRMHLIESHTKEALADLIIGDIF